jgi:hypothetical protein
VVTDQFFGHFAHPGSARPEKELLAAILADALDCYCKYSKSRKNCDRKLFTEAREWIFGENEDYPLSFVTVCDVLTLNPNYLRQKLLEHRPRVVARVGKSEKAAQRGAGLTVRASNRRAPSKAVGRGRNRGRTSSGGPKSAAKRRG